MGKVEQILRSFMDRIDRMRLDFAPILERQLRRVLTLYLVRNYLRCLSGRPQQHFPLHTQHHQYSTLQPINHNNHNHNNNSKEWFANIFTNIHGEMCDCMEHEQTRMLLAIVSRRGDEIMARKIVKEFAQTMEDYMCGGDLSRDDALQIAKMLTQYLVSDNSISLFPPNRNRDEEAGAEVNEMVNNEYQADQVALKIGDSNIDQTELAEEDANINNTNNTNKDQLQSQIETRRSKRVSNRRRRSWSQRKLDKQIRSQLQIKREAFQQIVREIKRETAISEDEEDNKEVVDKLSANSYLQMKKEEPQDESSIRPINIVPCSLRASGNRCPPRRRKRRRIVL